MQDVTLNVLWIVKNLKKKVREVESIGDVVSIKLLYWFDFEALINTLQDRLHSVLWMI